MKNLIEQLRIEINEGTWTPEHHELFAGADLIISDHEIESNGEVVVVSKYAQEISDCVFALKEACSDWLDYLNKYEFYPRLGLTANAYLEKHNDLKGILLAMLDTAEILEEDLNRFYYFAYGSNMDVNQMAERCPTACFKGKAILKDYRFDLDSAGYATIINEKGAYVEGLLWSVTREDLVRLDRYEGVAKNCYRKSIVRLPEYLPDHLVLVYISLRKTGARIHDNV